MAQKTEPTACPIQSGNDPTSDNAGAASGSHLVIEECRVACMHSSLRFSQRKGQRTRSRLCNEYVPMRFLVLRQWSDRCSANTVNAISRPPLTVNDKSGIESSGRNPYSMPVWGKAPASRTTLILSFCRFALHANTLSRATLLQQGLTLT